MSLAWVRRQYNVPAKRGKLIRFEDRLARVLSATNLLHVEFLDGKRPKFGYLHPMWHVNYEPRVEAP